MPQIEFKSYYTYTPTHTNRAHNHVPRPAALPVVGFESFMAGSGRSHASSRCLQCSLVLFMEAAAAIATTSITTTKAG